MWLQQNVKKLNRNSTFAGLLGFTSPGGRLGAFCSSTEQLQTELTGFPTRGIFHCESVAPQYTEVGAGASLCRHHSTISATLMWDRSIMCLLKVKRKLNVVLRVILAWSFYEGH